MNRIIYISLLLVASLIASCSKDFLEVEPQGNLTNETFLRNAEEMKLALNGVYDNLQITNGSGTWTSLYFMKNLLGDESNCGGFPETDQQEYQYLDDYVINSDNSKLEVMWNNLYKNINFCNVLTEFGTANEGSLSGEQLEIIAEAKALRAYSYFELVSLWGGVPLFTVNPKTSDEYHQPKATAEQVWAQIEKDLSDAIPVLPNKSDLPDGDKHRFVKGPATALLGKAYLFQKKYDDAYNTLSPLVATTNTEYKLAPTFADVWAIGQEFGDESLFEISYTSQENYNWGNIDWWPGTTQENNMEIVLQGARGENFWEASDPSGNPEPMGIQLSGWGFNKPTKKIGDIFYAQPASDDRIYLSVMSEADLATNGILRRTDAAGNPVHIHDYEGYLRIKYQTRAVEAPNLEEGAVPQMNMGTNWRIIRLADVILMAAEAANRGSQGDVVARDLVNRIRARANAPLLTNESGDQLFEAIKLERILELAFEGHRFLDLVRWGDTDEFDSRWQSHMTVLPIPKNEIGANNSLTSADQNPNY